MKNSRKQIVTTAVVVILFIALAIIVSKPLLSVVNNKESFAEYVNSKGFLGIIIFGLLNILQVIFAIIPAGPFEIAAGYIFGAVRGTIICDIAVTLGSLFVFFMVKKFGTRFTSYLISFEKLEEVKFLHDSKRLSLVVLLIFLIPGSPKDVITYAMGFTEMPYKNWIIINLIGRLPGIVLTVISGSALGQEHYKLAAIMWGITLVLYIVGIIIYNHYSKKKKRELAQQNN